MCNNKYIKAKLNLYNSNVHGNKPAVENGHYTCLFVILSDSVINLDKKYFSQIFLEYNKKKKQKKTMNSINQELILNQSDHEED